MKKIFTFLLVIFIGQQVVVGQCDPPAAVECGMAMVLCGLDELDGFSCTNYSINNPTGPNPLCSGSGLPENTQWWSFRGNGKTITINFSIDLSSCLHNNGIEAGVFEDCGGNEIDCNIDCNTSSFSLIIPSEQCHNYYLWVDGCDADVCDYSIQVTNGEAPTLPDPIPVPQVVGKACPGIVVEICVEKLSSCDTRILWIIDGKEIADIEDLQCFHYKVPTSGQPTEICVIYALGDGFSPNCDEKTSCFTLIPDPIEIIHEGELFVCWEDHVYGFWWRDSLIYNSCIDPPCKRSGYKDECYALFTKEIHLLEQQKVVEEVYKFVCDKMDLPFITEDGKSWYNEVSSANIVWDDRDNHYCETSYILHLEVFNPKVDLIRSCPSCNDTFKIESKITYDPLCSTGHIVMKGVWLNDNFDTLGFGDYVILEEDDNKVFYSILVQHTNSQTGEVTTCTVHDTSWHINIKNEDLVISGDTSICQVDTSEYSLPESYSHGCKIEWTLEDVNGQIITPAPDKMSTVKVHWPTHNTVYGKICAEIIDNCDSVRKVCFDLEGCVTTNNQNANQNQWSVFPNPARDIIYIQGGNLDKTNISMHDLEGNSIDVQPKQDISGAVSIDVSEMASGIYLIQLSDGKKKEVLRFVKL